MVNDILPYDKDCIGAYVSLPTSIRPLPPTSSAATTSTDTRDFTRWRTYAKGTPFFVWSVWALMCIAALAFVGTFGRNVPYWDEWAMVPFLSGDQAVDARWLWSEHNGHRIPLPRLFLLMLYKLTGADFRAGMYFNVLALAAL